MEEESVIWRTPKDATTSSAERQGLDYEQSEIAETTAKGSGIPPQSTSSADKVTESSPSPQENRPKNSTQAAVKSASAEIETSPTEAQKKAGNYKMGHVKVGAFDVTIENPKGSERSGTDANGKKWSVKMNNTYGYIRGTEGVSEEDAQGAAEGVTPQPATDATEKPTKPEVKYDYHVKMKDVGGNAVSGRVTNLTADGVEIEFNAPYNGKMVDRIPLADFDSGVSEIADANGNVLWNETEAVGDTEVAPQVDAAPTQVGQEDAEKPAIAQAEQDEAHKPTALERIPRNENGEPVFEQAENPEVAWDALVEFSDGNAATAKEIADAMTEEKRKALEKAQKLKLKGKTPAEMLASKQANAAELAKAEREYNHWQRIANVEQNRQNAIRAQQEAEARQRATERAEAERAEREAREEAERREREELEGIPEWHMDTPENARKRGARRYGGQIFTRQEPVNGVVGKEVEVKFSQKDLPKGHVVVIEAEQLQPSHIQGKRNPMFFIEEAQPKNRAEDVSQTAARNIAENIRPQEITSSTTAYTGAPTINTRGEVIQGNNRSDALRYLWQNNLPKQQQAYKQYLLDQAEQLGLDSNAINAMQHPVLVNQLDVDDAEAIRLGQMTAQDTESGGVERIKPKNVAQKLGDNMRTFANRLLSSSDNDATFGQLVDRNGEDVLNWMNQIGAISNTQYQSAFDSKGKLTPEAKNDLQKVLYQAVFNGGSQQLEEMFDRLPAKAQRAILSTAFRDMDSSFAGKMLPEIQSSIIAYNALMQDEGFASAKNMEEVLRAIETFKHQTALDDRFEQYMPADNFSNFALHLAGLYKASDMSQTTIASYFNEMYDLAQGKKAATLFEEADTTEYPLAEVIKKVLGIDYKPAKNGNNNVANGGADVALRNQEGQGRQPRSNKPSASGEQNQTRTESSERGGGTKNAGSAGGEKGNLPPTEGREESEENELDENGRPFIKAENGTTVFGEITDDSGLTAAPIKLSEGFQDANTGKGYGLVHIEANHGEQIRQAGFTSVKEFVSFVATHYDPDNIRVGKRRDDGSGTFLIQVTDTHDNTLFIELSKDGSYWNVNSGGIFRKGYSNKKETVAKTEPQQPTNAVSSDSSLSANVKDGITNAEPNGEPTVSLDKDTTLPADQQTSDEENTKKVADSEGKNTLKAKIEAASAEVNTDPTEAQKEAGNYKKGHVQVGAFDVTIENPKGSERSGTDANGKKWSVKMNNTYGYIRGTEGVDGDHIDVFLAEDMDKWDGKYVFVVDQYNPDGTFDEHKVMLGFNSMEEARSAYLSNYEKGWENGRRIVVARIKTDGFQKWVDSSHRKTKPFAHYVIAGAADVSDNEKKPSASKKGKPHASKENEVKRTVEHFPMETPEEAAAFDKRVPEMKDSELLAYMQEDGKGDINSAYHMNIYDEYDYRHTDEQTEAYNTYIQQLHDSNTTLEQAEEMLGNILGDVERFATDERSQLIGQSDALQDYITELERQKEDERAEAENKPNQNENDRATPSSTSDKVRMQKAQGYSEFAEKHGVNADDVRAYAEGMALGNVVMANQAFTEIRRTKRIEHRGMNLSEFAKAFKPIKEELYEKFGNVDELVQEYERRVEEERNMMEAARKKAEEEERKRQAHLDELSLLDDAAIDERYMEALQRGDEATAREMLDEAARRKGYGDTASDYQGVGAWVAPANPGYENDAERRADVEDNAPDVNIEDIALGYSLVDEKYWQEPRKYMQTDATAIESVNAIREAIAAVRRGEKNVKVKVYRAVPTSVKEGKLRNGDWVTPSKDYAKMHGEHRLEGKYRIIEDEVSVNELWWDGNDSREWGFDNGKGYKYKNVKNNRKSDDLVTRDDMGNVIPPSKRFNQRKADERYQKAGTPLTPNSAEVALRDAIADLMKKSGLDVIESKEGQRVLDIANGRGTRLSAKQKRALKTVTIADESTNNATAISSADGAKIQKNLESLAEGYSNRSNKSKGFITDLSQSLNLEQHEASHYGTFVTENGKTVTIRVSNHNARVSNFDRNGEIDGISIVISSHGNKGLNNDGNAHIVEFFYSKQSLERSEGKPLADIIRSVSTALKNGEFKDNTGLAQRQEVNKRTIREQRLSNTGLYNPRKYISPVRGQWTKDKILRRLKDIGGSRKGFFTAAKIISEFDSPEELEAHMYYHGTQYGGGALKPSILMSDRDIERYGGGGYGVKYWGISVSKSKKVASNFSQGEGVSIYPIILCKSAKVVEVNGVEDAEDLDEYIEQLWKDGVDAVWIGKGEQELCVLNPHAIVNIDTADHYRNYKLGSEENPLKIIDKEGIAKLYHDAKAFIQAYKKSPQEPLMPFPFEESNNGELEYKPKDKYEAEMREYERKKDEYLNSDEYREWEKARKYAKENIRFFRTSNGEAYGFTVGGKIYIDPRIATAETPIHEYAHLWATAMREGNPTEWKNIVGLMKGTSVWAEVQKLYPELKNDDDIADEVLATFSGRRGAERLRAEQQKIMQGDGSVFEKAAAVGALARVKQALSKFWKGVADFLGIHYTSAEEVADRVMKDLLEGVDPRKFGVSSNDDIRLSTSEELSQRYGSRWIEEQTNEDGRHTTQVKNTINSYKKFGDFVKRDSNGKNVSILDASSGLGLGTEWMRENGMNVDDVEPYPSENRIAPTYTSYNDIHKKYDYIISNAVLNVIPDDWRANVLHDMTDKLKKGGKLVINVRSAESIRKQGKEGITRITQDDASEILVIRPNGSIKAYQKGFTKDELKKWCETELGSDYFVEIANEKNAGGSYDTAVVVTKNSESDNILYRQGEDTPHVSTSSESKTKAAQKATENLNLGGRVVVHESAEGLEGREATAKGWYDTRTGQIHVVLSNNTDAADVTQTILHEAVAHHGLRELFGHNVMDAFLDSVLAAASLEVKDAINELRRGKGWNFRTATEEYLAGLAERTDFERMTAEERGLFATLRRLFNRALEFLGLKNRELSDRELAYILWCSYQNLKTGEKGRYVAEAERIAMRYNLKAGKNAMTDTEKKEHSVLLRGKLDNLQEILAKDTYERLVTSGSHLERAAWVDMLSPLQDLQHAIEKNGGFKLGDFENPYNAYITMSSRNYAQMDIYKRTLYADMIEAIHALGSETGRSYEEIKTYVMAKHGMERQKYMAEKAAEEAYDRYKSMHPFGQKTLDDFIDEYEEKSFAGLTELFGTQSVSDAMDEAQKYVEEVEAEAGSLTDSMWDSIRAATKSSLQRAYEAGLISKETYDNVSSMYQYYIPLRGFDEATSDEVYEYFGDQTINGGTGSFMKKAKGRKSVADDPFAVIGNMAEMAIMQSNRNLMKQQLLNLALNHPSDLISVSDLYVKFDEDYDNGDGTRGAWVPVAVPDTSGMTTEEANQVMLDFQDDMEEKVKDEPDTYALAHQKPHIPYRVLGRNMNEHQVMVKRGGKTYILTINANPRAAQAINGLLNPDATENPGAIALKAMTNWIARMATARNVEFAISNAMRDLEFSTTLIPKEGTEYYGRYVKNYLTCVKNIGRLVNRLNGNTLDMSNPLEKAFYDFIYNGGETGYTFMSFTIIIDFQRVAKIHNIMCDTFCNSFLLNRVRFRKELCSSPIPSHQKGEDPALCRVCLFWCMF